MSRDEDQRNPDPRVLASFRLGFFSRMIWAWLDFAWEWRFEDATHHGVPIAVHQLRTVQLELVGEISPSGFLVMPELLDRFIILNDTLRARFARGERVCRPRRTRHANEIWKKLCIIIDLALNPDHPLRPVYEFGVAFGEYALEVQLYEPPRDEDYDPECLPDLGSTISRARRLPPGLLARQPILRELLERCDVSTWFDKELMSREMYHMCSKYYYPCGVSDIGGFTCYTCLGIMIKNIDDCFGSAAEHDWMPVSDLGPAERAREGESVVVRADEASAPGDPGSRSKPRWDNQRNELWFGGRMIRKVRPGVSINITPILNKFEEEGWPDRIADPLDNPQGLNYTKRLEEAVRSLNDLLNPKLISFHVDNSGGYVRWSEKS